MELERHGSFEPLEREWDELADRAGAEPWLRAGWFRPWFDAFGDGSLELLALRREGRLAALGAFQRKGRELRALSNWHTPSFSLLAEDEEARSRLATELYGRGASRVVLMFLPPEDSTLDACLAAAGRHRTIVTTLERSPFVRVEGSWDDYLAARDGRLAPELRRRRRRLEEKGEIEIEVEDGGDRLGELLADGFRVEAAGWKGAAGTAIASRPQTGRFYTEIARWAAGRGWLRLGFLRVGGQAIAFDFSLEALGVHSLLKTGFDSEYLRYAPGKLLRAAMIERAFAAKLSGYDFLGDVAPWKLEWTDVLRDLRRLQAFAPGAAGTADWAAWRFGRPLAKRALRYARR